LRSCDINAIVDACKLTASPIAFISHVRKQVVIQFLNNASDKQMLIVIIATLHYLYL